MKTKYLRIAAAIGVPLVVPGCITTQLAYINEGVAGHQVSAALAFSGKEPVLTLSATKRGIPAGKWK